jgi:hypothetical protein
VARYVYSTPFIEYTPETPNDQYEVPEGYVAVIRQISVTQADLACGWWVYIQNSPEAPGVNIATGELTGFFNYGSAQGRWVCPGGGIITANLQTLGSEPNFYVGGYLLEGTIAG